MEKTTMNPILVTFVDLETTGLDPDQHEIIELGAVRTTIRDGNLHIEKSVNYKVMPSLPVDPFIARINGYNQEEWMLNCSDLTSALGDVFDLMRGAWFAGSNPKFDDSFLRAVAKQYHWNYPSLASYHLIDVTVMAFPLLIDGEVEKLSQETIALYYEIPGGGHRALADALQCCKIFATINNLTIV